MNIHEHQAKEILKEYGAPVSNGIVILSLDELKKKISNLKSEKFVLKIGKLAESEGHHPDINFGWGYAKIKISTHAIKGLAESDFILAAKIDEI